MFLCSPSPWCRKDTETPTASLDRVLAGLAGANADHLAHVHHEDLAIADLARARGFHDGVDRLLHEGVADDHLDLHFGQEIDDVFGAAIELRVTLLPPEPFDLGHGEARYADLAQRLAHFVELERFDDGLDLLHCRDGSGLGRGLQKRGVCCYRRAIERKATSRLRLGALAAVLATAAFARDDDGLWERLAKEPDLVVLMRHTEPS